MFDNKSHYVTVVMKCVSITKFRAEEHNLCINYASSGFLKSEIRLTESYASD